MSQTLKMFHGKHEVSACVTCWDEKLEYSDKEETGKALGWHKFACKCLSFVTREPIEVKHTIYASDIEVCLKLLNHWNKENKTFKYFLCSMYQ